MKKTYLSMIALFAALQFSYAQWTLSGTNIYNNNSGNVGIGTTIPNVLLDVYNSANSSTTLLRISGSGEAPGNYSGLLLGSGGLKGRGKGAILYEPYGTSYGLGKLHFSVNGLPGESEAGLADTRMTILSGGSVGIGTTIPHSNFHVNTSSNQAYNSDFGAISITPASDANKSLSFGYDTSLGTNGSGWIQSVKSGTSYTPLLLNPNNGDVAIGATDTKGYKLAVNGAAIATSMKVKLQANWPDFVFLKDYKLPTLTEVKTYIDKNQHLPDMPSADEVHANGLDLGEMNRLLLKKVEELTLYLIEKDKQVKQQEARIAALEAKTLK